MHPVLRRVLSSGVALIAAAALAAGPVLGGTVTTVLPSGSALSAAGVNVYNDGTVGLGGPAAVWGSDSRGRVTEDMVYGRVLLYDRFHGRKLGAGPTWQSLITHEVGHALNLAHRHSLSDAMYPDLTASAPGRYSAAELASLHAVLRTSGCDYAALARL